MNDMCYIIFGVKDNKVLSYITNLHPILWSEIFEDAKQFYSITRINEEIGSPKCKEYFEKCINNNIIDGLYSGVIINGEEFGRTKLL